MKMLTPKRLYSKGTALPLRFTVLGILAMGIALFAGSVVQAADQPASASVKFTVMAWDVFDPEKDLELNYTSGGKLRTLQAVWRDRSQVMECDGAGPLVFTRTVEREGKMVEVPVATAPIPQGVTRVLLVFGRNASPAQGESAMQVMVIDDSYTVFPGKSVRFLNYSKMTLGGSLGDQRFEVGPGGDRVVPAVMPEANRLLTFRLARRDEQGGWQKLRSTGLPMAERMRVLVFLIDDATKPGRPEMVMLRDREELPPEPPMAGGTLARVSSLRVNPQAR